jgi:N-acetylneuraminic acid mutarotase
MSALQGSLRGPAATDDPLYVGLFNPKVTQIPDSVGKQRYMTSIAAPAGAAGRWVEQPRLPVPVGEMGVAACQGRIHIVAGYARGRVDNDYHQVFDPATGLWSFAAPFPLPCNHIALVAIGTKLYSFGGFTEQNRCPHSKCFVYDTETDAWAPIAGLSRPRGAASAVVLDGQIHILGGRDVRSVEWHEIYHPATDTYTILAGMRGSTGTQPFVGQRDHMGVAVVDGRIHAIAGRMDSYDFNTALHAVYDPHSDAWSFRAPLPTPRSGPSCTYHKGRILVFGGEATGRVFGTNEAYDPNTDSWEALTPMALPRHGLHGATVAVIGDMVHVPGGGPVPGGSIQGAYHDAFSLG